jgi:hypothetical protein
MEDPNPPIGSVIAWAGPIAGAPSNWMACDGRKLLRKDYQELFDKIGTTWGGDGVSSFYLPDLRGQFLRGVDKDGGGAPTSTAIDPDRDARLGFRPPTAPNNPGNSGNDVGSFQRTATRRPDTPFVTDDPGDHQHDDPTWNGQAGQYELATLYRGPGSYDYGAQSAPTGLKGRHTHNITAGGDNESRPPNAYVYWIIRVK